METVQLLSIREQADILPNMEEITNRLDIKQTGAHRHLFWQVGAYNALLQKVNSLGGKLIADQSEDRILEEPIT